MPQRSQRKCALKTSIGQTFNLSRVVNHGEIKESLGDAQEFIELQPRCKKKKAKEGLVWLFQVAFRWENSNPDSSQG